MGVLSKVVATWAGWSWWSLATLDDRLTTGEFVFGFLLVAGFLRDFLRPPCPHVTSRPPGLVRAWALAHPWRFRALTIAAGAVAVFTGEYLIGWYTFAYSLGVALLWAVFVFVFAAWCRPGQSCETTTQTGQTDPA